jgi:tetratricopeptide (TPR) repeat protein
MLANLVRVPIAAIRQWHRVGVLHAKREVRRLPYFDFEEVGVARKLAELLQAGCSLTAVNRKLEKLARSLPNVARPLADPAVVVEGRCLVVRRDDGLAEPTGQLLIDFDATQQETETAPIDEPPAVISMADANLSDVSAYSPALTAYTADNLRVSAVELAGEGLVDEAVDAYRALLCTGEFTAEDQFALAELLYQSGDLRAARERYYMAIELDENFVEARSNLACVLAELGETGLSEAAFRGALEYHPDYADAHYHLARLLDREGRAAEASQHWQMFLQLAPESPWADEARERVGEEDVRSAIVGFRSAKAERSDGLADIR